MTLETEWCVQLVEFVNSKATNGMSVQCHEAFTNIVLINSIHGPLLSCLQIVIVGASSFNCCLESRVVVGWLRLAGHTSLSPWCHDEAACCAACFLAHWFTHNAQGAHVLSRTTHDLLFWTTAFFSQSQSPFRQWWMNSPHPGTGIISNLFRDVRSSQSLLIAIVAFIDYRNLQSFEAKDFGSKTPICCCLSHLSNLK